MTGTSKKGPPKEKEAAPIAYATWPDAAPMPTEERVLSVVCGNTHVHWAVHQTAEHRFAPILFWRTNALTPEDIDLGLGSAQGGASVSEASLQALSVLLPDSFHDFIFGVNKEPTKENVIRMSNARRCPKLSIFVVSSNDESAKILKKIWSEVPCRMHLLRGEDFYSKQEGRYEGMGVDRCATLRCSETVTGYPTLVFDGGTALTYTALDQNGKIMGGGITLGFGAKFRSIADSTGALPFISHEECMALIAKSEAGDPLPVFASNTKEAIMVNVLSEVENNCRSVIDQWLSKVGPTPSADDNGNMEPQVEEMKSGGLKATVGSVSGLANKNRRIVITGGDADVLTKLLAPDRKRIVEAGPNSPDTSNKYAVQKIKNAIHFGIASVLENQVRKRNESDIAAVNEYENSIIGQRVAKRFPNISDTEGDSIFRGTVVVINGNGSKYEDFFKVRYDDNDSEDLTIRELRDALLLFSEVGDKASHRAVANQSKNDDDIRKSFSKHAAAQLGKIISAFEEEERKQKAAAEVRRKKEMAESAAKRQQAEAVKKAKAEAKAKANAKRKREMEEAAAAKVKAAKRPKMPKTYKNRRIAKFFDDVIFFGTIVGYTEAESDDEEDEGLWKIAYDDGDTEEFDITDLNESFKLYAKNKIDDHMAKTKSISKPTNSPREKDSVAPAALSAPAAPAAPAAPTAPTAAAPEAPNHNK